MEDGFRRFGSGGREVEQARAELESLTDHVEHCEETIRNARRRSSPFETRTRGSASRRRSGCFVRHGSADCDDRMRDRAKRISEFAIHLQRRERLGPFAAHSRVVKFLRDDGRHHLDWSRSSATRWPRISSGGSTSSSTSSRG